MAQEQQSNIIQAAINRPPINGNNAAKTLQEIQYGLKEPPTQLSKQIIKAHYVKWYIHEHQMNGQNTVSLIRQCGEIFSEGLRNEPAKHLIKDAFASWFILRNEMNSENTVNVIRQCGEIFSEGLGNEPAKYHIKDAFVSWFIPKKAMNSENTVSIIRQCGEIFSEGLGNESAKYRIKNAFAFWFTKNHAMNHATTETLFRNCGEIFGEGLNINEPAKYTIQNAISEPINNFSDKLVHEDQDIANTRRLGVGSNK